MRDENCLYFFYQIYVVFNYCLSLPFGFIFIKLVFKDLLPGFCFSVIKYALWSINIWSNRMFNWAECVRNKLFRKVRKSKYRLSGSGSPNLHKNIYLIKRNNLPKDTISNLKKYSRIKLLFRGSQIIFAFLKCQQAIDSESE